MESFFREYAGFFCLAIIKGPPNDIYFIIEGPYDGYFTEKVSQAQKKYHRIAIVFKSFSPLSSSMTNSDLNFAEKFLLVRDIKIILLSIVLTVYQIH